jgi:hypothetical protein
METSVEGRPVVRGLLQPKRAGSAHSPGVLAGSGSSDRRPVHPQSAACPPATRRGIVPDGTGSFAGTWIPQNRLLGGNTGHNRLKDTIWRESGGQGHRTILLLHGLGATAAVWVASRCWSSSQTHV